MNPLMSFVAIVSLLLGLATAGNTVKEQTKANPTTAPHITPSKIALNHNETIVNDAALVQPADAWSQWLTSLQVFFVTSFSSRPKGGGCDEFGCGMNHNETIVSDAASVQPADAWSQWLTSLEAFFVTSFSSRPQGGGCDEFGCGTNHNETMVRDAALVQPADAWSQWLTSIQMFLFTGFSTSAPRHKGGCEDPDFCGTNHNETMVRDAALVQPADAWSQWLTSLRAFFVTSFSTDIRSRKGGCDEFGCGTNHNETMVNDAALEQPANNWSQWLTRLPAFCVTSFSTYASGDDGTGGCPVWGCGSNHNETMVSETSR